MASFGTREEAESAQEILEEAGISSILRADDVSGLIPTSMVAHSVLVPPSDERKAREVLEDLTGGGGIDTGGAGSEWDGDGGPGAEED